MRLFRDVYSVVGVDFERQTSGAFHGKRTSMDSLSFRLGAVVKMYLRYSYGLRSFSFAVSMMLKTVTVPKTVKKIGKKAFAKTIKLRVYKKSYAEKYAKKYGIKYKII